MVEIKLDLNYWLSWSDILEQFWLELILQIQIFLDKIDRYIWVDVSRSLEVNEMVFEIRLSVNFEWGWLLTNDARYFEACHCRVCYFLDEHEPSQDIFMYPLCQ